MAGDLTGMFNQLNRAITANPLGEVGGGLMDSLSQSFGGAMGAATGRDPMSFQSERAKVLEGEKQISQLDVSTPEGAAQAAQLYQKMGMMDKSIAMADRAKQLTEATNAKNKAVLDAGNAEIQEEAARKKKHSQKVQAILLAKRDGDQEAVDALQAGAMEPDAYLMKRAEKSKSPKPTVLADGAMAIDAEGNVIAHNPKDVTGGEQGDLTATMQKRLNTANDNYFDNMSKASEYGRLLEKASTIDLTAGWAGSVEREFNKAAGRRDDDDYFRTSAIGLRNHEMVQGLPPGVASDKDVALVLSGYFPDNASKEEIMLFLSGAQKLAQMQADFEKSKADWISANRDERGFAEAWANKMEHKEKQHRLSKFNNEPRSAEALAYLKQNNTGPMRDAFIAEYGIDPSDLGVPPPNGQ